jgi:ribosomal protein S19
MHKSKWKLPYIDVSYFQDVKEVGVVGRSLYISDNFYKKIVNVHNGQTLISLSVKKAMLGHKFGEFSITKVMGSLIQRKKKKKKKK